MKKNLLKNSAVQTLVASLICIVLGLFLGYLVPVSYTHLTLPTT